MALTVRSAGQSPIDSSAVNQYQQLFTGVMTDQQVTFASSVFAQKLTSSQGIVGSSNAAITGTVTSSNINSSGAITTVGAITAFSSAPSSAAIGAFKMGSSGPTIYWGSSIPTIACTLPSLFFNTGGSSTTGLYVCMPNSGGASSSNWDNITGFA